MRYEILGSNEPKPEKVVKLKLYQSNDGSVVLAEVAPNGRTNDLMRFCMPNGETDGTLRIAAITGAEQRGTNFQTRNGVVYLS